MTAEIIRFIPRPKQDRRPTDLAAIAFRLPVAESSVTDHAGAVRRDRAQPDWYEK
jgi:hypothetical protein